MTDARFVPVPADDRLEAGLAQWEARIAERHEMPAVVEAGVAHYQFETLHPLQRRQRSTRRLIVLLQLLRRGELGEALLEVSPWFEQRRREYQDELLNLSATGDFDRWVRFFATGIGAQAAATVARINDLLTVHGALVKTARTVGKGLLERVAEGLLEAPYVTARRVMDQHGVTRPAANAALNKLVAAGVLRLVSEEAYRRLYAADQVIEVLLAP